MLFYDNPISMVIPFKEVTLFLKFYKLRNTDKPSAKGMECMELSVVKDSEIIYLKNYALKNLNFINSKLLSSIKMEKMIVQNIVGFGRTIAKIISFQIEITPDIFIQLDNKSNNLEANLFEVARLVTILSQGENDKENCVIEQENFSISSNFIKSIEEYNKFLYNKLVETNLLSDFKTEREIDDFWLTNNIL